MNVAHLAEMANQIGDFFDSQGPREEAVAGIESHLRRFWEPRMLQAIVAYAQAGGQDLKPSVAEAVRRLGTSLAAAPAAAGAAAPGH